MYFDMPQSKKDTIFKMGIPIVEEVDLLIITLPLPFGAHYLAQYHKVPF